MKEYKFIKNKFFEKHKNIDDYESLEKYIMMVINYDVKESVGYCENHHILPISTFPEYEKEKWNIIKLGYEDHKLAHLLIFKAINIRKYQRPLNWMMRYYKNGDEISKASKRGWVRLKSDKEKYEKWRNNRSNVMKSLTSEEQRRRSNIFWGNITGKEYEKFCKKMKDVWTEEKRLEKSIQMNEYYSYPDNINKKRLETKKRWDNLDNEERVRFKEKMRVINSDEIKRNDASIKIKKKWLDNDYLEKMRKRNKNPGTKLKIINTKGDDLFIGNMTDITKKYNFSPHLMRKYRDSGNKIEKVHLKNDNLILLDCIIETLK